MAYNVYTEELIKKVEWNGTTYGFIPNLSEITMGEYVDIENHCKLLVVRVRINKMMINLLQMILNLFCIIEHIANTKILDMSQKWLRNVVYAAIDNCMVSQCLSLLSENTLTKIKWPSSKHMLFRFLKYTPKLTTDLFKILDVTKIRPWVLDKILRKDTHMLPNRKIRIF